MTTIEELIKQAKQAYRAKQYNRVDEIMEQVADMIVADTTQDLYTISMNCISCRS